MKSVKCIINGRVQGVWFRGSTQTEAQRLGVSGWAENLADGSVEVVACGDDAAVDALVEWLHAGPQLARVTSVEISDHTGEVPPGFSVR